MGITYVRDLQSIINGMADDIGCDGGTSTGSHKIPSRVNFYVDDDDSDYKLVDIETDRLGGCGCPIGITFRLKKL